MRFDEYGSPYLSCEDVCDLLYKNPNAVIDQIVVDNPEQFNSAVAHYYADFSPLKKYVQNNDLSVEDFDRKNLSNWYMPIEYKELDIADYIINLCTNDIELNRVGEELLLYQERNLFDLLRFLKYMVDTFKNNDVVYGIGRGSSVASYVLYLLGVHRINSIAYDIDIREFLK